jgi:hypothetical protein
MPDDAQLLDARYRVPKGVVIQEFPTETVVLQLETGQFHGLNPTAAAMLHLLKEAVTPRVAAERIAADAGQPPERVLADIASLVRGLLERRLLVGDG